MLPKRPGYASGEKGEAAQNIPNKRKGGMDISLNEKCRVNSEHTLLFCNNIGVIYALLLSLFYLSNTEGYRVTELVAMRE